MKEFFEFLRDAFAPVSDAIKSRLSSPLTSSFVIAWCATNYKFILIIFSDNQVSTIFRLINNHIYPDITAAILRTTIPFFLALFYLIVYERFSNYMHKRVIASRTQARNEQIDAAKELYMLASDRLRYINTIDRLSTQLNDLKLVHSKFKVEKDEEISYLEKTINDLSKKIEPYVGVDFRKTKDEAIKTILNHIEKLKSSTMDEMVENVSLTKVEIETALQAAIDQELIMKTDTTSGKAIYILDDGGVEFLRKDVFKP